MLCSRITALLIFGFTISQVSSLSLEFNNYKLYRVVPENNEQLQILISQRNSNSGLFFWNGIDQVGKDVDVLVSPDVQLEFIETMMIAEIPTVEYFSDVNIIMGPRETLKTTNCTPNCGNKKTTSESCFSLTPNRSANLIQGNILANVESVIQDNLIPIEPINNTSLLTGVFYTIGMRRFPNGYVALAEKTSGTGNYVQIDFKPSTRQYYNAGGKWHNYAQWIFAPTELNDYYTLTNRGDPDGVLTWTHDKSPNGHFIQISQKHEEQHPHNSNGENWIGDTLINITSTEVTDNYLLTIQNLPHGIISWTNKYGGGNNKLLQVDISTDGFTNYDPGMKWRYDALFNFVPTELKLTARMSDFNYEQPVEILLSRYRKELNLFPIEKITMPNNCEAPQSFVLKHRKTIKNKFSFDFGQSLKMFSKVSVQAKIPVIAAADSKILQVEFETEYEQRQEIDKIVDAEYTIEQVVTVPPNKSVEIYWHCDLVKDVEIPFSVTMEIFGFRERMTIDKKIQSFSVDGNTLLEFLSDNKLSGEIVGTNDQRSVLLNVKGSFKGTYGMSTVLVTEEI